MNILRDYGSVFIWYMRADKNGSLALSFSIIAGSNIVYTVGFHIFLLHKQQIRWGTELEIS
jgi:hypothetical protein